jgi:hypothetical protein
LQEIKTYEGWVHTKFHENWSTGPKIEKEEKYVTWQTHKLAFLLSERKVG